MKYPNAVFKLRPVVDDRNYEGFGLFDAPSALGREELLDDMCPAYGIDEKQRKWVQPKLMGSWKAPKVVGKFSIRNDYPCINLIYPVFSERACNILSDLLLPNGELLPISSRSGKYYFYNITTIIDAMDRVKSDCEWHAPSNVVIDVIRYEFIPKKVIGVDVFRYYEEPTAVFVSERFVARVVEHSLGGFSPIKVWPLPKGTSWRKNKRQVKDRHLVDPSFTS